MLRELAERIERGLSVGIPEVCLHDDIDGTWAAMYQGDKSGARLIDIGTLHQAVRHGMPEMARKVAERGP